MVLSAQSSIVAEDSTAKNIYYNMGDRLGAYIKSGQYLSLAYNNNLLTRNTNGKKIVLIDWFNIQVNLLWG